MFLRQIGLSERIGDLKRLHSAAEYAVDAKNVYGLRPALFQGCVVCIRYFSKRQEALDRLWYATKVPMMEMFHGLVELSSVYEKSPEDVECLRVSWTDFFDEYIDVLRELVDSKFDRIGEYLSQHLCLRKDESLDPILADIDGIVAPDLPEFMLDDRGPMEWRTEKCAAVAGINFESVIESQTQTALLIDFDSTGGLDGSDTLLNSQDREIHPDLIGINFEPVIDKKGNILDLPPLELQSECLAEADLSFLEPPPAFADSAVPSIPLLIACARDKLSLERLSSNEGNTVNCSARIGNNLFDDCVDIDDFAKPAKTGLSGEIARRCQRLPLPYLVMSTVCWIVFCLTLSWINFGIPPRANEDIEISFAKWAPGAMGTCVRFASRILSQAVWVYSWRALQARGVSRTRWKGKTVRLDWS